MSPSQPLKYPSEHYLEEHVLLCSLFRVDLIAVVIQISGQFLLISVDPGLGHNRVMLKSVGKIKEANMNRSKNLYQMFEST